MNNGITNFILSLYNFFFFDILKINLINKHHLKLPVFFSFLSNVTLVKSNSENIILNF